MKLFKGEFIQYRTGEKGLSKNSNLYNSIFGLSFHQLSMHPGVNKKADVMDNIQDIWLCTCYWSRCYWGSDYWSSNNTGWWSGPSLTASSIWLCIQLPSPWNTIAMIVQPHDGWLMRGTIEVCTPPAVTSLGGA